jgi:hypothetical protein
MAPDQATPDDDEAPTATDNTAKPEDGDQDVDQEPTPIPGSPTAGDEQ